MNKTLDEDSGSILALAMEGAIPRNERYENAVYGSDNTWPSFAGEDNETVTCPFLTSDSRRSCGEMMGVAAMEAQW